MAATLPFVFKDPEASPLRPSGPRAKLILPPRVNDPAAINDRYRHIFRNQRTLNPWSHTIACSYELSH